MLVAQMVFVISEQEHVVVIQTLKVQIVVKKYAQKIVKAKVDLNLK